MFHVLFVLDEEIARVLNEEGYMAELHLLDNGEGWYLNCWINNPLSSSYPTMINGTANVVQQDGNHEGTVFSGATYGWIPVTSNNITTAPLAPAAYNVQYLVVAILF